MPARATFIDAGLNTQAHGRAAPMHNRAHRGENRMQTVEGRIVLVTGAAMGMGRLYAERAVAEGAAAVVLWDIDGETLAATRDELVRLGRKVHATVAAVATAPARVRAEVGDPDIVITNAGVVRSRHFWEHDPVRDTEFVIRINTLALMHVAREFLPAMIANKRPARLLNVASA